MKVTKFIILGLVCLGLLGCGDDEGGGGSDGYKLTPAENKARLEQTGTSLLSKISADDHKKLVEAIDEFNYLADEYSLEIIEKSHVSQVLSSIRKICVLPAVGVINDFTGADADIYKATDYYGIYTFDNTRKQWKYTEANDKLQFSFPCNGQQVVITLAGSSIGTEVEVDDYTRVIVPEKMDATIKMGSEELMKMNIQSKINNNAKTAQTAVILISGAYQWNANVNISNQNANSEASMLKSGETLISGSANITGNDMVSGLENDVDNIADNVRTATFQAQALDVIVSGNCSAINTLNSKINDLDNSNLSDETLEYNQKLAELYNKYVKMEMRYSNSDNVIANIQVQPYLEYEYSYGNYEYKYYDIEPIIVFAVDNSRYSFEDYFDETSFSDLIKSAEDLYNKYESFVKH